MDWSLCDRDLRHERVKEEQVLLRIGTVSYGANKSTIFGFSKLEKIFPNERVRRFYTGNTYILCRAKL